MADKARKRCCGMIWNDIKYNKSKEDNQMREINARLFDGRQRGNEFETKPTMNDKRRDQRWR